jgi:predicted ArsR family transcriptional regulator
MEHPRARESDPITSWIAADQAKDLAKRHHKLILSALKIGNMGKDGICSVTGLDGVQVARRLPELQRQGLVCLTGKTVRSLTGRPEREWQLA